MSIFKKLLKSNIHYISRMLRLVILLQLFCFLNIASASNLDSLWSIWNDNTQPDTNRIKALHNIAGNIIFSDPDSTYTLALLEYDLAKKKGIKNTWQALLTYKELHLALWATIIKPLNYLIND